jgi:general secretion pathway protein G
MVGALVGTYAAGVSALPPARSAEIEGEAGTDGGIGSQTRARQEIVALQNAVYSFLVAEGRLPEPEDWPQFLLKGSASHPRPYLDTQRFAEGRVEDPWGRAYLYRKLAGTQFEILSFGADGAPGGKGPDEDLTSKRRR